MVSKFKMLYKTQNSFQGFVFRDEILIYFFCLSEFTESFNMSSSLSTYAPKKLQRRFENKEKEWIRSDNRGFLQCRPAFLKTGSGNAASGSAFAEFGSTKVIVSIFGPRESKKAMMYSDIGRLNCSVSLTTFATPVRSKAMMGFEQNEKDLSSMLYKALEGVIKLDTFPKTTVDVFALVLQSGGSDLSVIISCASLALADAGIQMYDLLTSVSVARVGNNLIIDPTNEEENEQDGNLTIAYMPSRNEVSQVTLTGEWSTGKINQAMEISVAACFKLGDVLRNILRESE